MGTNTKPASVKHVIQIESWNFDYLFGVDDRKIVSGLPYWESRRIQVRGKILKPALKASAARISLSSSDGLVSRELKSTESGKPIGYISYRAADYSANLFMPSDAFGLVLQAFAANRYHWISMDGAKSGNGEVMVHTFMLLESIDETD